MPPAAPFKNHKTYSGSTIYKIFKKTPKAETFLKRNNFF